MILSAFLDSTSAFDALFTTHYRRVARLIYRVVGDVAEAEELASEVFWKLHRKPPLHQNNIEGWLSRTALHLALDSLRKRKRRSLYEALFSRRAEAAGPEQLLEQAEEAARVRTVLASLGPGQAELLVMRGDGYTCQEIAAALNLNLASLGTMIARAESAFRNEYEERYGKR